jgi:membrane protease YdiL (CAAX protease family)
LGLLAKTLDRFYLVKEHKRLEAWHRIVGVYTFIFISWGIYRLLFRFPVWLEEAGFKALVFGIPVFYMVLTREKQKLDSLGITITNLFESVYLGLGLGILLGFFGQVGNFLKNSGSLELSSFGLSLENIGAFLVLAFITAWWEELFFMGYLLTRLLTLVKSEWKAAIITSVLFALIHIPARLVDQTPISQLLLQLILLFSLGVGNSILMIRTRNLAAPIMAHALWGVTVFMFR